MASAAAGESSPPPPGGWLSGLVSGAGRILAGVAAVLGSESSSDATSSDPESSQSPPRRARSAADQGDGAHFALTDECKGAYVAYDNYQFDKSGKEIVLKDYGKGSCELASHIDRKDAIAELLMQETFTRLEYVALKRIIQERIVDPDPIIDEPDIAVPIAWQPSTWQCPVALSPHNPPPQSSGVPAYNPLFDNTGEKRGLKKGSTTLEDPCTLENLSRHQGRHVVKRSYSDTADTFEEPRRIRSKLNRSNTSRKDFDTLSSHGAFDDPVTYDAGEVRGCPEELKNISLLGTDNLTFSHIASKRETARPVRHLATTSRQVKVEPFEEVASLEPEIKHLARNNDEGTMSNAPCPDSKMIFQKKSEAAPSSSGLQIDNSSRNCKKGFNLQGSFPTKARSPANSSRPPSNRCTIRSWNGPPQQSNPAPAGQEPKACHIQEKRPVGRPRKTVRSRNSGREVKIKRKLQL